jgi:single-strand DNA-binding protein
MFNKIILIGNLTKDPELRYSPQGTPVSSFGLAVNSNFKSGEQKETLFIDVVVFGKQAEACGQYLSKGRPILVEGRLRERRWEYEGQKRYKCEVVAQNVRFLGRKDAPTDTHGPEDFGAPSPADDAGDVEPF